MSLKLLPLVGALTLAAPAFAITVNITDFTYGSASSARMTGTPGLSPSYEGQAGQFTGEQSTDGAGAGAALRGPLTADAAPSSFVAWCAELTQTFLFHQPDEYSLANANSYFGAQKATDLSRLFTAAQGFVVDSKSSAAMQAGIWEIIYETDAGYGFTSGKFFGAPTDLADQGLFNTINGFLTNLGSYSANYHIDVLTNGTKQDFLVATVPEPETWAMFVAGLGVISLLRRRRKD